MKVQKFFTAETDFEKHYLQVRQAEGRILTVPEIQNLPETPDSYRHHQEWNQRKKSTRRLLQYITNKKPCKILDIGCGNGWFLYKVADSASVLTGIDVNQLELNLAAEALSGLNQVDLIYGDVFEVSFKVSYDIILLNACVQYFEDFFKLIQRLKSLLAPGGEIHIVDSPFYINKTEAQAAKDRSSNYYQNKGVPEMANHYFHHSLDDLEQFDFQVLYNPSSLHQRIKRKLMIDSPFYWIKVA